MYQTQGLRRRQHAGYKEYMRAYYEANKEKLNARRKEKRKEARDTFQKLIDEKKKVGRPPLPIEAMMVPKELAKPLNLEQMVFLGKVYNGKPDVGRRAFCSVM